MSRAWLSEDTGVSDHGEEGDDTFALGTFSAHVEDAQLPDGYLVGPQSVPVDQALAWAREHARRVVITYMAPEGEPYQFTAGSEPAVLDGSPLPSWPPDRLALGVRRNPEWWFLDRTDAAEPIEWDVRLVVTQGWGDPQPAFPDAYVGRLRQREEIVIRDCVAMPGGGLTDADLTAMEAADGILEFNGEPGAAGAEAVRVRLTLQAGTRDGALDLAGSVARRCLDEVLADLHVERKTDSNWAVEADAYPLGSTLAEWNLSLSDEDEDE